MLCAANLRYLEFISAIDTPTAGIDALRKIWASVHEGEHSHPGFKLFDAEGQAWAVGGETRTYARLEWLTAESRTFEVPA
jgi:hypothetical protein